MITAERLHQLLIYDPETGNFVWLVDRGGRFKAGMKAGSIDKSLRYVQIRIERKLYLGHRLAWLYMYGVWPKEIDHINRNRSDNRIENLREAPRHIDNVRNQSIRESNTSGVIGVHWQKNISKWFAYIGIRYRRISLGYFDNFDDAVNARKSAERHYFGDFAPINGDISD
jgi:hypothetical protein